MVRPRDDEKQRRILRSTLLVVERQGLDHLSMEAVAKEAHVAIGTLYVYFESKEALLTELYVRTKTAFAHAVFGGVAPSSPVRPAFEQMSQAYMRYLRKYPAEAAFMRQVRAAAWLPRAVLEGLERTTAPLVALLERGKSEGLLKKIPTPLMLAFLQTSLSELSAFVDQEPPSVRASRDRQVTSLAWDALKA